MDMWTDSINKQREQREIAHEAELERLRGSDSEEDKALLTIAEELYKKECEEFISPNATDLRPCTFQERSPGFQMRLVDLAFDMLETHKRVKKILDA